VRQLKVQTSLTEKRLRKKNKRAQRHWSPDADGDDANFARMKPAKQLDLEAAARQAEDERKLESHNEARETGPGFQAGLVLTVTRDRVRVRAHEEDVTVMLRPDGRKPAVGDRIQWHREAEGPARLIAIEERRTVLSRPDPHNHHRSLVLAANVDVAVIVASAKSPGFRPALIDRCLIAIWHGGSQPLICLSKVDLLDDHERAKMLARLAPYEDLGITVLPTSTESHEGVPRLLENLTGKTCVLIGHSGVGKSSLLNVIDPERERRTKTGREFDGKGRHTTTSSELVELPGGTRLIDTPGIRSFGLWEITANDVVDYFPELVELGKSCRFGDCTHLSEPHCAVQLAVESGALHPARFDAYRRIRESL
jgi:ribosome biogenesis GTPase